MKYQKSKTTKSKKPYPKRIVVAGVVVVFAIGVLILLETNNVTNFYKAKQYQGSEYISASDEKAVTTSTAPSAQENFTDGGEREPGTSESENKGNGIIVDGQGQNVVTTDEANWVRSKGNEITIYSPSPNSVLRSNINISGSSIFSQVSYRIIDNISGVIGSGVLNVVDGYFSGSIKIESGAAEGRLDIFGVNEDGVELGNIEIKVSF